MKIQKKKLIWFIIIVALVVISQLSIVKGKLCSWSSVKCQLSDVNNDWYAVTLTNNQIYFGHILTMNDEVIKLSDVHFLEIYSEPSEKSTSANFALETQLSTPKQVYKLNKKGGDKIATTDHTLSINRSSVLFWEKLSSEAEVVKQINKEDTNNN